jgi:hypothetical protein
MLRKGKTVLWTFTGCCSANLWNTASTPCRESVPLFPPARDVNSDIWSGSAATDNTSALLACDPPCLHIETLKSYKASIRHQRLRICCRADQAGNPSRLHHTAGFSVLLASPAPKNRTQGSMALRLRALQQETPISASGSVTKAFKETS